jgi:tetratricopeptide (TPR) repeat protein
MTLHKCFKYTYYFGVLLGLLSIPLSTPCFSQGTSVLSTMKGADIDFSKQLNQAQQIKLDDPFLIQLYSRWKALGAVDPQTNEFFNLIFTGQNSKAFLVLHKAHLNDPKFNPLKKPVDLYLLYKLGYFQTFYDEWATYSVETNFTKTELGLALDQVVAPQSSQIMINQGFFVDSQLQENLKKLVTVEGHINYSLQGYQSLRSGSDAIKWIGKLKENDELRLHLAHTAILDYGRKGELGASGKLISKVVEPWIENSQKPEEIALYYMTLGRLLYQAGAYEQAEHFYYLIPESSRYFLEARTEALWVQLQERDFPTAKGQLESLKINIFTDQFYPEIFLAQAIGNTMMCQFIEAQRSIQSFIQVNKSWAKRISHAVTMKNPPIIKENFYVSGLRGRQLALQNEKEGLKALGITSYQMRQEKIIAESKELLRAEAHDQWMNRKALLEGAIYKMGFVRVELLSRMRAIALGLKDTFTADKVSLFQAAPARESRNEMSFPNDGMLWGDELFRMNADVYNMCLQGKFYESK